MIFQFQCIINSDTEGSFRAERLQNIAERFNVDKDTVLEQVVVARAFTVDQQQQALVNISAKMSEEPFRMLIVDSVMSNLRQGVSESAPWLYGFITTKLMYFTCSLYRILWTWRAQ